MILGIVAFWYGLVPVMGALIKRYKWFKFRGRFNGMRLHPLMDRRTYWRMEACGGDDSRENPGGNSRSFRFFGELESVTDSQALWVRGGEISVPVFLKNAETYFLPAQSGEGNSDPGEEAPEKINWERVSSLVEGAKVFVGGQLSCREGRWGFASTRENPLMVIFYDGPDYSLATNAIWAGRQRGEYFNPVTPYSLIIGALCLLFVAASFLPRPAFRLTVVVSIAAIFVPLFPLLPPGLLFTVAYRRLTWRSRILRAYSDLAKLPLLYFGFGDGKLPPRGKMILPDGEPYGFVCSTKLPPETHEGKIPMLIPEITEPGGNKWYMFGTVRPSEPVPSRPGDPFAVFGILPGNPPEFARHCTAKAYMLETFAWILLLAGIALNVFFLRMVLYLLI